MRCEVCFILRHKRHLGVTPQRRRLKIFHLRGAFHQAGEKWRCPQWQRCGKWRMIRMMAAITGTQSDAVSAKADKINNPSCDWKGKSLRFTWVTWFTSLRLWFIDESVENNGVASLNTSQNKVVLVNKHRQKIYQSSFIDTKWHKDGGIRLWSWCREPRWKV